MDDVRVRGRRRRGPPGDETTLREGKRTHGCGWTDDTGRNLINKAHNISRMAHISQQETEKTVFERARPGRASRQAAGRGRAFPFRTTPHSLYICRLRHYLRLLRISEPFLSIYDSSRASPYQPFPPLPHFVGHENNHHFSFSLPPSLPRPSPPHRPSPKSLPRCYFRWFQ